MGRGGFGGRRGGGGGRAHHRHHGHARRLHVRRRFGYRRRRIHFYNRRVGFRRRYYGHYWGYNPYYYSNDIYSGYASPAMAYQTMTMATPPTVNFRSLTVNVIREAVVMPQAPTNFNVTCPPGCSQGSLLNVNSPFDGRSMTVTVPEGIKEGMVFTIRAPPTQQAQPIAIQSGLMPGQQMAVDTDGDGITDTIGTLQDIDGDGIPDVIAVDVDHDGIIDQFLPVQVNGQNAHIRVEESGGRDVLQVTVPGNVNLTMKILVDAIENFLEGKLERRYQDVDTVEDLDFTVQFVQMGQHQWVNGQYRATGYEPLTMNITVPHNAKPSTTIQVAPPPGYDPQNTPIPIRLPATAVPGQTISVVLPEIAPTGQEIPVAQEVPGQPQSVAPMLSNPGLDSQWAFEGDFNSKLSAAGNMLNFRGVETVTHGAQEVPIAYGRGCRIGSLVFIACIVLLVIVTCAIVFSDSGGGGVCYASSVSYGNECTYPTQGAADLGDYATCWDCMDWSDVVANGYDDEWMALGWTDAKWANDDYDDTASDLYWSELNSTQLTIVSGLGFTSSNWIAGGVTISPPRSSYYYRYYYGYYYY